MADLGTDAAVVAILISLFVGWVQFSWRQKETDRANAIKEQAEAITELRLKVQALEGRAQGHGQKLDEVKEQVGKVAESVAKIDITLARMANSGGRSVTITGNGTVTGNGGRNV